MVIVPRTVPLGDWLARMFAAGLTARTITIAILEATIFDNLSGSLMQINLARLLPNRLILGKLRATGRQETT